MRTATASSKAEIGSSLARCTWIVYHNGIFKCEVSFCCQLERLMTWALRVMHLFSGFLQITHPSCFNCYQYYRIFPLQKLCLKSSCGLSTASLASAFKAITIFGRRKENDEKGAIKDKEGERALACLSRQIVIDNCPTSRCAASKFC